MAAPPKPGEPGFVPRYSSVDLDAVWVRIAERRALSVGHGSRAVLDGDTEIMEDLAHEVASLRIALESEKEWRTKRAGTTGGCNE